MTFGKRRNLKDIENTLTSSLWLGHILERRDEADATELPKLVFPRAFMCACVPACVRLCARLCACVPACGCVCVRAAVRAALCACVRACVPLTFLLRGGECVSRQPSRPVSRPGWSWRESLSNTSRHVFPVTLFVAAFFSYRSSRDLCWLQAYWLEPGGFV